MVSARHSLRPQTRSLTLGHQTVNKIWKIEFRVCNKFWINFLLFEETISCLTASLIYKSRQIIVFWQISNLFSCVSVKIVAIFGFASQQ